MKKVIAFEAVLASIMEPDEARRDEDKNYHRMSISDLHTHANFVSTYENRNPQLFSPRSSFPNYFTSRIMELRFDF